MKTPDAPLSITDHDRDVSGMTYVYPVVSRRSGGVSIGINLNVNNACNWRCIYCQVPDLKRGGPPPVDLDRLRDELDAMLRALSEGDFMARHVPEDMRHLRDIALSGNGEPTSAAEFPAVIDVVGAAMGRFGLAGSVRPILISNGSLVHKTYVRDGLRKLAALGGEVWFKLDRATETGIRTVNDTAMSPERVVRNLSTACALCPTWIQTCVFSLDGAPPSNDEIEAYLDCLRRLGDASTPPRGVLLYGLARPVMQAEVARLARLPEAWLRGMCARIEAIGFPCRVFP